INLDEGVSLPISILNQMRRECIDLLSKSRIKVKNRNYKNKLVQYNPEVIDRNKDAKIRVKVKNLEQLESAIKYNVDVVYYEDIATLENALEMGKESKKRVIYSA
ncbi:MAG: U32 family peptidase, partial [Peptostreptococcaceae bacterium]